MQRQVQPHKTTASGKFETTEFSFVASAEAFKIISDNLYSRPVEAVVRELACNAFDSHVKVGKRDVPIVIKVPTRLDDTFYVQDFGTGLTPEEIRDVYTVVFKSDKTHTNELTGCFGLGSKSPFSVVSQFSIESVVNGRKWIYSAYLNDNRIPTVADMSDGGFPVHAPNGVKISFPVNDLGKVNSFYQAAIRVVPYFDIMPQVIGCDINESNAPAYKLLKKDFYGIRSGDRWRDNWSHAIMGNVCYDIDQHKVGCSLPPGLDLFFELGELSPTPSREHLQYDERTKGAIKNKFDLFQKDLIATLTADIDSADTLWDARVKAENVVTNYKNILFNQVNQIKDNSTWKGKTFLSSDKIYLSGLLKRYVAGELSCTWKSPGSHSPADADVVLSTFLSPRFRSSLDVMFVVPDDKKAYVSKVRHISNQNPKVEYYLLSVDEKELKEQKKVLKKAGAPISKFLFTSKLERPPSATRGVKKEFSTHGKFKILLHRGHLNAKTYFWRDLKPLEAELPEKAYYVFASRGSWGYTNKDVCRHPNELCDILSSLEFLGMSLPRVYGVVPSASKHIPKTWQPVSEFKEIFQWIAEEPEAKSALAMAGVLKQGDGKYIDVLRGICHDTRHSYKHRQDELMRFAEIQMQTLKDEQMRELARHRKIASDITLRSGFANLQKTLRHFGLHKEILNQSQRLLKETKSVLDKYPLLLLVDYYTVESSNLPSLYEYINLMAEKNKKLEK